MKNIILYSLVLIQFFLTNCSKNEPRGDGLPYYEFTQEERNKLIIKPKIGDEIIYRNQNDEIIKFKVYTSERGKTTEQRGTFVSDYVNKYFHYDHQQISMRYLERYEYTDCKITIRKYPVDSNYSIQPPVIGTPKFYGYFEFPLWNGYYGTNKFDNTIFIYFDNPITMSFNGKTFTKVLIFESNKTEILDAGNELPLYTKNVNKIYYDYNYGIIGFDDLNGKMWRIQ